MLSKVKTKFTGKTTIIFFMMSVLLVAQNYKVVQVNGDVKFQTGTSEVWNQLKEGTVLSTDNFILTGEKSSVKLQGTGYTFSLNEMSAISVGSIKTMSTDDLLLALAMENMINTPKTNGKGTSNNTATYGEQENGKIKSVSQSNDFGIRRLNGAVQLARNGMKESSIVFAKETYRKYPDSKQIPSYRIFFADILYEKGLYEEALSEYMDISKLELKNEEKNHVQKQIKSINQIMLNK